MTNQNAANQGAGRKPSPITRSIRQKPGGTKGMVGGALLLRGPVALVLLLFFCDRLSGQNFSMDWLKVFGGGGTSSGGPYSLSGTVGQAEAGPALTGGAYSLAGGFWALYAAPTQGSPALHVLLSSTNTTVVWWPSAWSGWALQQNSNLVSTNWGTPTEPINDDGKIKSIVVKAPAGNRFYRLANP